MSSNQERLEVLRGVRTAVVKVGTNVLSRPSGEMALGRIHGVIEALVDLQRGGTRSILVTSGAISMGMHRLRFQERPTSLRDKQACAAVGQIRLMAVYQEAFDRFGIPTAQVLLTEDDFTSRTRYLNLRNAMSRLLELGVLPIVNENDTVSTSEIEEHSADRGRGPVFGDNDELSALVASKLGADLLLILSDVDGLYPRTPEGGGNDGERPISVVPEITAEVVSMASGASGRGRGGMARKLQAIRIAVQSGIPAVVANGSDPTAIAKVLAGADVGTLFLPRRKLRSRKHWIAFASSTSGRVHVNEGARDALTQRGSSLLFRGVVRIEDDFRRGDVLSILDPEGREFARGMSNYGSEQARLLIGKGRDEIATVAGADYPEFINRDNIALRE